MPGAACTAAAKWAWLGPEVGEELFEPGLAVGVGRFGGDHAEDVDQGKTLRSYWRISSSRSARLGTNTLALCSRGRLKVLLGAVQVMLFCANSWLSEANGSGSCRG